jgi:hypothetical protein
MSISQDKLSIFPFEEDACLGVEALHYLGYEITTSHTGCFPNLTRDLLSNIVRPLFACKTVLVQLHQSSI